MKELKARAEHRLNFFMVFIPQECHPVAALKLSYIELRINGVGAEASYPYSYKQKIEQSMDFSASDIMLQNFCSTGDAPAL